MRYTVHAELGQMPVEYAHATAVQAISKAWILMGCGAKKVYIFDDKVDVAYWPHEFCDLHRVSMAEAAAPAMGVRRWFYVPKAIRK
jgi:hypothetical protein